VAIGTYNYTMVVFDTSGNWANDTVFVFVVSESTSTTSSETTASSSTTSTTTETSTTGTMGSDVSSFIDVLLGDKMLLLMMDDGIVLVVVLIVLARCRRSREKRGRSRGRLPSFRGRKRKFYLY